MLKLIPITDAAKLFPTRNGKALELRSIRRRILRGCRGVRLRAIRDGHQWFTTEDWVADFQRALTQMSQPTPQITGFDQAEFDRAMKSLNRRYARRGKSRGCQKEQVSGVRASTNPKGSLH